MIYITTVVNHYIGTVEIYPHYDEVDAYITASNSAVRVLQNLGLANPSNVYYQRYVTFLGYATSNMLSDLTYAMSEYDSIVNAFPSQDITLITILKKQIFGTVPAGCSGGQCTTSNSFIPGIAPAPPIKTWNFGGFNAAPNIPNPTKATPIIPVKSTCKGWGCGTELYTDEEYCWKCGRKDPTK